MDKIRDGKIMKVNQMRRLRKYEEDADQSPGRMAMVLPEMLLTMHPGPSTS